MRTGAGPSRVIGRYALFDAIAAGGMATVHIGRLMATAGFSRTVAIKRLHANLAHDPQFVAMFTDEARLAARIRHSNVVQTLDVVALDGELFVVMDYVAGDSLAAFLKEARRAKRTVPVPIATRIMCDVLHGLHAAHEARSERGKPLGIVHRDVSPQNVLVGLDGVARVLDFGVALAMGRVQSTPCGQVKGKLSYMAPEQLRAEPATRRSDVYAAGIVLWETITGARFFAGASEAEVVYQALHGEVTPARSLVPDLPEALDGVISRALEKDPEDRFATALDMAAALERACEVVSARQVAEWVSRIAPEALEARAAIVAAVERGSTSSDPSELAPPEPPPRPSARPRSTAPSAPTLVDAVPLRRPSWLLLAASAAAIALVAVGLLMRAPDPTPRAPRRLLPIVAPASPVEPARTATPLEPAPSAMDVDAPPSTTQPAVSVRQPTSNSAVPRRRPRAEELLGRD